MAVQAQYLAYVLEQLAGLGGVATRRMFGGVGLYSGESFFALIDDDVLFFKVDDSNRDDYVSRNMKAFMPIPGKGSMNYYQVPEDVIEEADELARWARRSVEVALKKKKIPKKKKAPGKRRGP